MNNLQRLLRFDRNEIQSAFERASVEGQGTAQEVSDRREEAIHEFFRRYFPFPYRIAKGNISDSLGQRSQSIDCLVLNPSHPHTVNRERYSFIVCEAVDYAVELKPNRQRRIGDPQSVEAGTVGKAAQKNLQRPAND